MIARWIVIQRYVGGSLVLLAIVLVSDGAWIYTKAHLAQVLIKQAWQQTIDDGKVVKPWPWADTWPVAQLRFERLGIDLYVLNGSQGHALAFGPGYMNGSAKPNEGGVTVIAGHRDTHFSFMEHLRGSDVVTLIDSSDNIVKYRVTKLEVVDSRKQQLSFGVQTMEGTADIQKPQLLLVTCYPFDVVNARGPLRYVATAVAVNSDSDSPYRPRLSR